MSAQHAQHTQRTRWYLDSFPWRVGDEYMYRWTKMTATETVVEPEMATATGMGPATEAETETETAGYTWCRQWSHRPLTDGIG